jgi:hypothetical protein
MNLTDRVCLVTSFRHDTASYSRSCHERQFVYCAGPSTSKASRQLWIGKGFQPRSHVDPARQLDGSRAAFDQLAEIVDAVGDRIDVMMDGGVQRGAHQSGVSTMSALPPKADICAATSHVRFVPISGHDQ